MWSLDVFISLNLVRILSLIGLLLVFSSSILVMVNDIKAVNHFMHASSTNSTEADDMLDCDYIEDSTVPNQPAGAFWAVTNRLLIIAQVIVLILSEIGWPMSFFQRFFPVLGQDFGLGALGIFQGLIGAAVLSHHVDDFSLVSAFFLFAIACVNMLLVSSLGCVSFRLESYSIIPTGPHFPPESKGKTFDYLFP